MQTPRTEEISMVLFKSVVAGVAALLVALVLIAAGFLSSLEGATHGQTLPASAIGLACWTALGLAFVCGFVWEFRNAVALGQVVLNGRARAFDRLKELFHVRSATGTSRQPGRA
jgi:hypothetical protein